MSMLNEEPFVVGLHDIGISIIDRVFMDGCVVGKLLVIEKK